MPGKIPTHMLPTRAPASPAEISLCVAVEHMQSLRKIAYQRGNRSMAHYAETRIGIYVEVLDEVSR